MGCEGTAETSDFTVNLDRQGRYSHLEELTPSDVPLLLVAGAVEGGAEHVVLDYRNGLRFRWNAPAGPSLKVALAVLQSLRMPYRWSATEVVLPPIMAELLNAFFLRCRHAPLHIHLPDGRILGGKTPDTLEVSGSRTPSLTLVDRGVSFPCPISFPGLQVVAHLKEPLGGAPWPRNLLFDRNFRTALRRLHASLKIFEPF